MVDNYPARPHWWLYGLLYCTLLLLTAKAGYAIDLDFWIEWATYLRVHELGKAYEVPSNNYNPLYQYVLYAYARLAGSPQGIEAYVHCLKTITLIFDFGGAILAVRCFGWGDGNQRFLLSLLFLLNIGYLYNTLVWEQVDAIVSTLVLAAVVQALRRRSVSSLGIFVVALNMKTQAIVFMPPLVLLVLPQWWVAPTRLLRGIALGAGVQALLLAPFIWAGSVPQAIAVVSRAVGYYPRVTLNCYNMWASFFAEFSTHDYLTYGGLTYKTWGLFGFLLASALILLPLALTTLHKLRTRTSFERADHSLVLLSLGLISLVFCFFNTQMHERYWHPALVFLGAHALLTRRYVLFGVCSLAYYLNLEAVMHYLGDFSRYPSLLFRPKLVAMLFAAVLVSGTWQLYRLASPWAAWQLLRQPPPAAPAVPA